MKVENIDVTKTVERVKQFIAEDKTLSPAARSMFELLLIVVQLFIGKFSTNSKNSSKPPSQDPNRDKGTKEGSDWESQFFLTKIENNDLLSAVQY